MYITGFYFKCSILQQCQKQEPTHSDDDLHVVVVVFLMSEVEWSHLENAAPFIPTLSGVSMKACGPASFTPIAEESRVPKEIL